MKHPGVARQTAAVAAASGAAVSTTQTTMATVWHLFFPLPALSFAGKLKYLISWGISREDLLHNYAPAATP